MAKTLRTILVCKLASFGVMLGKEYRRGRPYFFKTDSLVAGAINSGVDLLPDLELAAKSFFL